MDPNKSSQSKANYQGALSTMNSRNLSPATQEILRLRASKAEEAICKEAAGIDTHPFFRRNKRNQSSQQICGEEIRRCSTFIRS